MTPYWEPDFPPDLRLIVEPLLHKWVGLIPTWCQEFVVRFDPRQDSRMAAVVNYRNRWGTLIVTGQWFENHPEERENSLVHELVHLGFEPLSDPAGRFIESTTEAGTPLRSLADSMFTDGLEAAVEDMARSIIRVVRRSEVHPATGGE